jgi:thiamine-monophosphate kinase
MEENSKKLTNLDQIGEFGLIDLITKDFDIVNDTTELSVGDDAAILDYKSDKSIITTDMLVEGVHFDLSYFPLKHLGYKSVVASISDICAMNGITKQITVSIAVSNRFKLESIQELYSGINLACKKYNVDLVGGDTTSSLKGLVISVTAIGTPAKSGYVTRAGSKHNDLVVVSGSLGDAYLGLQVLEREKQVFLVNPKSKPDLSNYKHIIERQLKPEARNDVIDFFTENDIKPTSMIDISDGLSSEILHLCKNSGLGCRIYEEKIPIAQECLDTCEEFKLNSTTIALSGGEDYELLFTIDSKDLEKIEKIPDFSVIGYITKESGVSLISKDGKTNQITSMGWKSF